MTRKLVVLAAVMALATVLAAPAGAAAAVKVADFYTAALDADGNFRLVHCDKASQKVNADGVVRENYSCEFVDGLGIPVLPETAMRWDWESSIDLVDDNIVVPPDWDPLEGPYRWFSDVEDILTGDLCWWYSLDWTMVITPSGKVNVTVVYDFAGEATIEGPDCP